MPPTIMGKKFQDCVLFSTVYYIFLLFQYGMGKGTKLYKFLNPQIKPLILYNITGHVVNWVKATRNYRFTKRNVSKLYYEKLVLKSQFYFLH